MSTDREDCCPGEPCYGDPHGLHTHDCPLYQANVAAYLARRPGAASTDPYQPYANEIARFDQAYAEASEHLDSMIAAHREHLADGAETRDLCIAGMAGYVASNSDLASVAQFLAVAIHRLAATGRRECDDRRWKAHEEDWANGVLLDCPESWDGDEAAEHIALSYVATLEARLDAAGISREKWGR